MPPDARRRLIKTLKKCQKSDDTESAHVEADEALVEYINDEEISKLYYAIAMWYA